MGTLFSYSLASGIFLAVAYVVYRLLLAGARQPRFNRGILMSIYAVSLTAPLLITILTSVYRSLNPTAAATTSTSGLTIIQTGAATSATADYVLLAVVIVYMAGVAVVAVRSIVAIAGLIRLAKRADRVRRKDYTLLFIDGCEVPFSFVRYIAGSRADIEDEGGYAVVHEKAHLRLHHWIDLLVAQAVSALMWYNPAAWLMRAELRRVHEYQADEAVIASGMPLRPYQELLIEKAAGVRLQALANCLNNSNISKRITMMYQKPSRPLRRLASLAMIPAVALTAVLIMQPAVASAISAPCSVDSTPGKTYEPIKVTGVAAVNKQTGDTTFVDVNKLTPNPAKTVVVDKLTPKPDIYIDGELYTGDLDNINPETIESISVLKDDPAHPGGVIQIVLKK